MALIKCPECGREVSEKALSCPNCGKSIMLLNQKNLKLGLGLYEIIYLAGAILMLLAPFFVYYSELFIYHEKYSMWQLVTGTSEIAIPYAILIASLFAIGIIVIEIIKKKSINKVIKLIIPIINIVLVVLFEIFVISFEKSSLNEMQEIVDEIAVDVFFTSYKGFGFYLLVIGIAVSLFAVIFKDKLNKKKSIKQEERQNE